MTKYQGKSMESLTPVFKAMTEGIHRLQRQEAEEEAKAMEDKVSSAATDDKAEDMIAEPARKQRKTMEDLTRRCRRALDPRFGAYCSVIDPAAIV